MDLVLLLHEFMTNLIKLHCALTVLYPEHNNARVGLIRSSVRLPQYRSMDAAAGACCSVSYVK